MVLAMRRKLCGSIYQKELCGISYVVNCLWCNICCASYVVQAMKFNLSGIMDAMQYLWREHGMR
eukprot:9257026-Pyramimonas_sp.AAC.1